MVSGSIKDHHKYQCFAKNHRTKSKQPTNNASYHKSLKCHDCLKMVSGSIQDHHRYQCSAKGHRTNSVQLTVNMNPFDNMLLEKINNVKTRALQRMNFLNKTEEEKINSNDVYFIIDMSGSMSGNKLTNVKLIMPDLVDIMDGADRIAIMKFAQRPNFILQPRSIEQIIRQDELFGIIKKFNIGGMTALYDTIDHAINQLHDKSKKTIFHVLTDGEDNASRCSYENILEKLKDYPNIILNIIHIDNNQREIQEYKELCSRGNNVYKVVNEVNFSNEYLLILKIFISENN
jgi:uncharacterized protein with von Willebrand factor type A (vWA) domain